jgi:hypothetical protein
VNDVDDFTARAGSAEQKAQETRCPAERDAFKEIALFWRRLAREASSNDVSDRALHH